VKPPVPIGFALVERPPTVDAIAIRC